MGRAAYRRNDADRCFHCKAELMDVVAPIAAAHDATIAHDVAFLSIIMALGTFIIAMMLRSVRRSRYLVPTMREFLAAFGPTIAAVALLLAGVASAASSPGPACSTGASGPTETSTAAPTCRTST